MTVLGHSLDNLVNPERCEEFGYGLGTPGGILILRYRSSGSLSFGPQRQDFLHQLYWSPDGVLASAHGPSSCFTASEEAFWARRAVVHEVTAGERQTVYRVCLREVPPGIGGLHAGPVSLTEEAALLVQEISRPGYDAAAALAARERIMAGLAASSDAQAAARASGLGFARSVARRMTHDPGDPTGLAEWADHLRISVKTLQRDFTREFGMSYTTWRTKLRLSAARALLRTEPVTKVAHRVGYGSPSAFIAAYAKEYGHTPGRLPDASRGPLPAPGRTT
ncbi:helix-turn-helix transcriptional regulator [Actinomadura rugatobispora]|uniref:Helix-turn-helix transcriptional regulator n=1 Tax=Actinomadura rugatobispora TaxID=1994 RepID=A0ABW1AJR4_9ACTN|nr:helix-turn-helix transcriptional regulator [Actinomadura rugatobispora]